MMLVELSLLAFFSFRKLSNCFKFALNRKSIRVFHMSKVIFVFFERFPIECSKSKTKTKVVP